MLHQSDGNFLATANISDEWFHLVLNFIGPKEDQGTRVYHDGVQATMDSNKGGNTYIEGNGRIVIGRRYSEEDCDYASVQVDELLFFNRALTEVEIGMLSN